MAKSDGTHKTQHYAIGRGVLYLCTDRDANGRPRGYSDTGNLAELNLNVDEEILEHISPRAGLATADREIKLSVKLGGTFILENFTLDNLAHFLSGTLAQDVEAGSAVVGDTNVTTLKLGQWFDLFKTAAPTSYPLAPADRA